MKKPLLTPIELKPQHSCKNRTALLRPQLAELAMIQEPYTETIPQHKDTTVIRVCLNKLIIDNPLETTSTSPPKYAPFAFEPSHMAHSSELLLANKEVRGLIFQQGKRTHLFSRSTSSLFISLSIHSATQSVLCTSSQPLWRALRC